MDEVQLARAVRTVEVVSYRWPGGAGVLPPDVDVAAWRTRDGDRYKFADLVAGADEAMVTHLAGIHIDAVKAILAQAVELKLGGGAGAARTLVAAASRLANELAGTWSPTKR
jgi:hypothetical protein